MSNSRILIWIVSKGASLIFFLKLLKCINFLWFGRFYPFFSLGHRVWGVKNQNFWKKKRLTNSRFAAKRIYPHLLKSHDSFVLAGAWKIWIFIKKSEIVFLFQKIICLLCFLENIVSNLNWESNRSKKHKCKTKIFQMSYCTNFCLIMVVIYAVIFRYKWEKSYCIFYQITDFDFVWHSLQN